MKPKIISYAVVALYFVLPSFGMMAAADLAQAESSSVNTAGAWNSAEPLYYESPFKLNSRLQEEYNKIVALLDPALRTKKEIEKTKKSTPALTVFKNMIEPFFERTLSPLWYKESFMLARRALATGLYSVEAYEYVRHSRAILCLPRKSRSAINRFLKNVHKGIKLSIKDRRRRCAAQAKLRRTMLRGTVDSDSTLKVASVTPFESPFVEYPMLQRRYDDLLVLIGQESLEAQETTKKLLQPLFNTEKNLKTYKKLMSVAERKLKRRNILLAATFVLIPAGFIVGANLGGGLGALIGTTLGAALSGIPQGARAVRARHAAKPIRELSQSTRRELHRFIAHLSIAVRAIINGQKEKIKAMRDFNNFAKKYAKKQMAA